MFRGLFEGWTPVIIIVIIVLLFGAPKLPGLARSLGQSMRIFRGEMKTMKDEKKKTAEQKDINTIQHKTKKDETGAQEGGRMPNNLLAGNFSHKKHVCLGFWIYSMDWK